MDQIGSSRSEIVSGKKDEVSHSLARNFESLLLSRGLLSYPLKSSHNETVSIKSFWLVLAGGFCLIFKIINQHLFFVLLSSLLSQFAGNDYAGFKTSQSLHCTASTAAAAVSGINKASPGGSKQMDACLSTSLLHYPNHHNR